MSHEYLAGRGIADITGEPAGVGMLGYGKHDQRTAGLHTRQRARAFAFASGARRVLLVVCELPLMFETVTAAVHDRLASGYGVQDMPWVVVTGPDGRILAHHLGWLSAGKLAQLAASAQR